MLGVACVWGFVFFLRVGERLLGEGLGGLKFPEFQGVSQSEVSLDF